MKNDNQSHQSCCSEYAELSRRNFLARAGVLTAAGATSTAWLPRVVLARPGATPRDVMLHVFLRGGLDGLSFIVPVFAGATFGLARWISPDVHGQILWMLYEFGFFALCIYLARIWVPERVANDPARVAFLRSVLGYSAAYYALWWVADFIIVFAELDLGWAIRIVPNQLYYALWVPFVYWRFFSASAAKASQ